MTWMALFGRLFGYLWMVYDLWDCVATIPLLSTLHWRTRWWLRRCISYFQPRQYPLSMYFVFATCFSSFRRHWCQPVFSDGASQGSRKGSHVTHVYEINTWLWDFCRPQPGVRGLLVATTEKILRHSRSETSRRAWKTRQAWKRATDEEESSWSDMTCINRSYTCHISMLSKRCIWRDCVIPPA
jgi:hypothetical protein